MIVHNQELNEIKYLMERYYDDGKLDVDDLTTIKDWADTLKEKRTEKIIIPPEARKKYQEKFFKFFKFYKELNKEFEIDVSEIDKNNDLVIDFVTYNGGFELATTISKEVYYLKNKKWTKITDQTLNDLKLNFDNTFGKDIDENLNKLEGTKDLKNTRRVTIDKDTNFNKLDDDDKIKFILGIQENSTGINNYISPIMVVSNSTKSKEDNYDTFKLCPPDTGC